ncbi:MAG: hypothetical protein H7125_03700, partial [Proteobacteria bacterium]|nr:hypothetical protein [Burkholderiales bacterium]
MTSNELPAARTALSDLGAARPPRNIADAPLWPILRTGVLCATLALAAGCATLEGFSSGESVDLRATPKAGSELVFQTRNAYNREPRSLATQRFSAEGSRIDGLEYNEAGSGGFGKPMSALIAQQFNARGDVVAWERADGTRTTF